MQKQSITQKGVQGTAIIRTNERLSLLSLTIQARTQKHSAHDEALRMVYADALLSGTGSYTREQFHHTLNMLGSDIQVSADGSGVSFSMSALDTTQKQTLALFQAMFKSPTFSVSEIKRIKELLINTLILSKEDAKARAYRHFTSTLTEHTDPRHYFAVDTVIAHINEISVKDLTDLHASLWEHEWLYTCGGSEVSCEEIGKTVLKLQKLNKYTSTQPQVDTTSVIQPTKRSISLIDIPHRQNIEFSIGGALPILRTDPEYAAFVFGMNVLAHSSFAGRLMITVRTQEGLTYMIYGQVEMVTKAEEGFWRIRTFFNPTDATKGIQSTLREIDKIRAKGITEDELKRFKAILHTRFSLIEDSLLKKVRESHALKLSDMNEDEYEAYKYDMQHMTCARVLTALKKYLNTSTLVMSGAGPIQSIKKEFQVFQS
jgi:predicted Zn-dependent peptidase